MLLGIGFGVGLVLGLVWEEPELVYEHLTGAGETVLLVDSESARSAIIQTPIALANDPSEADFGASSGRAVAGDTAVPAVARGEKAESQTIAKAAGTQSQRLALGSRDRTESKELPKVAAPVVAKPESRVEAGLRWAIQVGAFSEEKKAQRLVRSLKSKNYPVVILPSTGSSQRWRVRIQPLVGEERARGLASQLKREEGLPTWVLPMETDSR